MNCEKIPCSIIGCAILVVSILTVFRISNCTIALYFAELTVTILLETSFVGELSYRKATHPLSFGFF